MNEQASEDYWIGRGLEGQTLTCLISWSPPLSPIIICEGTKKKQDLAGLELGTA